MSNLFVTCLLIIRSFNITYWITRFEILVRSVVPVSCRNSMYWLVPIKNRMELSGSSFRREAFRLRTKLLAVTEASNVPPAKLLVVFACFGTGPASDRYKPNILSGLEWDLKHSWRIMLVLKMYWALEIWRISSMLRFFVVVSSCLICLSYMRSSHACRSKLSNF